MNPAHAIFKASDAADPSDRGLPTIDRCLSFATHCRLGPKQKLLEQMKILKMMRRIAEACQRYPRKRTFIAGPTVVPCHSNSGQTLVWLDCPL